MYIKNYKQNLKTLYLILENLLRQNYVLQNFLEYLNSGIKPKENITMSLV